jgi:hypothetical protein
MTYPAMFDKSFLSRYSFFMKHRSEPLLEALIAIGGISELARNLGVTRQAVSAWNRVPLKYVKRVSELTNIPHHRLRPDLYEQL